MFVSLILGVLAGLGATQVIAPIAKIVEPKFALNETEKTLLGFGAALLLAGLVASIVSSGANPFFLMLGGLLGVFGRRLYTLLIDTLMARPSKAGAAVEEAADAARDAAEDAVDAAEDAVDAVVKK